MKADIKKDFTLNKIKYRCEVVKQCNGVICVRIISPGNKRNIYSWGPEHRSPFVYRDNDTVLESTVIAKAYKMLGFNFSNNHLEDTNIEVAATRHDIDINTNNKITNTESSVLMYKVTNITTGAIAMFTDGNEAISYSIGKTVKVDTFNLNCETNTPIVNTTVDVVEDTNNDIEDVLIDDIIIDDVPVKTVDDKPKKTTAKNTTAKKSKVTAPARTKTNTVPIDYEDDEEEEVVVLIE